MSKTRLESFSDGVIAILITIMVFNLKAPQGDGLEALRPRLPAFLNYALSFVFLGIYWNNHHHLLHAATHINGRILWANLHLLFWLSLVPFVTSWMGENYAASMPTAAYGLVLLAAGVAFTILLRTIVHHEGKDSVIAQAVGKDRKDTISLVLYALAIPLAFLRSWISQAIYVAVVLIWLVPDRRIERKLEHHHSAEKPAR
jgi:uncharacterized membrane protein